MYSFNITSTDKEIQEEKRKARRLRKTNWWKNKLGTGVCYYCGKKFPQSELTMDHIIPLIRGGKTKKGNIAVACKECNNKKKYLLPIEWDDYLSRLKSRDCK
ncbi:MAG: HNH endonuclease [Deferribacterota bacterium]|nr:HNH endonuclease [Deferribacterota bacterium]